MVSYIISVRRCEARISAATLIVYSGLSRSSMRSDIGANSSTGTFGSRGDTAWTGYSPRALHDLHVLDSSRVHPKWCREQSDCAAGLPSPKPPAACHLL